MLTTTAHSVISFSVFNGKDLVCIVDHDYHPACNGKPGFYLHHWNVGDHLGTTKVAKTVKGADARAQVLADINAYLNKGK